MNNPANSRVIEYDPKSVTIKVTRTEEAHLAHLNISGGITDPAADFDPLPETVVNVEDLEEASPEVIEEYLQAKTDLQEGRMTHPERAPGGATWVCMCCHKFSKTRDVFGATCEPKLYRQATLRFDNFNRLTGELFE